ncbi:PRC-barrel domain-containing protein [Microbacterium sp.]|uniref:PRC-barrel domain-containing protein n=1 Tax=Microbacterium sp. TaxID=51671 RepID=UPI00262CA3FE|nr:PRC-barrel domain-containing protein [uncultured Microbacterium sp.]
MNAMEHELVALTHSDQTIAQDDDIRGRIVKDAGGEEIGKVDELLIDSIEGKVRFLVVASGGFLGLGEQKSYIPVDSVSGVSADDVHIDQSSKQLRKAPAYDPELINDPAYNEDVYGFYGLAPFWAAGYAYPSYPYYR